MCIKYLIFKICLFKTDNKIPYQIALYLEKLQSISNLIQCFEYNPIFIMNVRAQTEIIFITPPIDCLDNPLQIPR